MWSSQRRRQARRRREEEEEEEEEDKEEEDEVTTAVELHRDRGVPELFSTSFYPGSTQFGRIGRISSALCGWNPCAEQQSFWRESLVASELNSGRVQSILLSFPINVRDLSPVKHQQL
eukprot:s473_g11.t1